uniref:Uncharacterized protein n=1 Tax=Rhizophora mucronata TaxID=61149 RepID=A0A2P2M114_RHIMU
MPLIFHLLTHSTACFLNFLICVGPPSPNPCFHPLQPRLYYKY